MSRRARLVAVLALAALCAVLVAGVAVGPATGVATAQDGGSGQEANGSDGPEHVNPDDAEEGDEAATAGWLEGRLGELLSDGAIELSEGEYELAQEFVGEEYQERFEQYVDVAGDGPTEEYEQAGQSQAELAELLTEYQETLESYRDARDRGDEERARELARELADLAEQIEALGVELEQTYEVLGEETGGNYSDATDAVNGTVSEVTGETDEITEEAFVATSLSVTANGTAVAADDPLQIEGQLTDENGTPAANATIAVADPAGATAVTTDADGRFVVDHQPVLLPANATELSVAFRPDPVSPYAPATASVPVDVRQVEGELSIADVAGTAEGSPTVAFGDEVPVTVTAGAGGAALGGVPVRATLDGAADETTTDSGGVASPTPVVNVDVAAGERSVRVAVPADDRAVTFDDVTAPVMVEESSTALAVTGESGGTAEPGTLPVTGQLDTDAGEPVPDATIELVLLEGGGAESGETTPEPVGEARTDGDGRFAATIDAPAGSESVVVRARFDGAESNLQSSNAETSIPVAAGGSASDGGGGTDLGSNGVALAVAVVIGLGVALVGWIGYRRGWIGQDEPSERSEADPDDAEAVGPQAPHTDAALEDARARLDRDPTASTMLAYGAARSAVAERVPGAERQTHREFLATCAADGLDESSVASLRTLTDRYEAAVYGPTGIDADGAREALSAAEALT